MTENLKVIEFECECDFCNAKVANLKPVNAGLWAICQKCYDHIYGEDEEDVDVHGHPPELKDGDEEE